VTFKIRKPDFAQVARFGLPLRQDCGFEGRAPIKPITRVLRASWCLLISVHIFRETLFCFPLI
jgi:hypothetical protein